MEMMEMEGVVNDVVSKGEALFRAIPIPFQNPHLLVLLVLVLLVWLVWLVRGRGVVGPVVVLRMVIVLLLVMALANPTPEQKAPQTAPLMVLVDQSDSLTPRGQATLRERATRLVQAAEAAVAAAGEAGAAGTSEDTVLPRYPVLLWFGGEVVPVEPAGPAGSVQQPSNIAALTSVLRPSASNLEQALRIAREMAGPTGGRIVLLSDGIQTTGNVLNELPHLTAADIPVDVWPVAPVTGPEVRISGMSAPQTVRVGEEYQVQVGVELVERPGVPSLTSIDSSATGQVQATVRLWESLSTPHQQDGGGSEQLLAEQQIGLGPGPNRLTFPATASGANGVIRLRAEIAGVSDSDTFVRNNEGVATTVVALQPRVLLVEGQEGNASELSAALWRTHIESEVIAAADLPPRLSDLGWYDGMVLLDVSAHDLSLDQMSSVREFVRSEGRGLLVTGGLNAYSLGGYKNTPLESVLPVQVDPPPRTQRADVALLLIIDRSASMSIPIEVSKLDMAKEAAILSTEMLQSDDHIGILAFDTGQSWTVPFQQVGQGLTLKQIQDTIVLLGVGGGTDIYGALNIGLTELMRQQASVRHAVILTDGRSFTDDRAAYRGVVDMARSADVTLSTIAIGVDADTELLNELAQWGNGRYYFADQPEDIPRLTLQESEIARADPVIEGDFYAELAASHPLLHGLTPGEMPHLNGYVATTRKEQAEVVLQAPTPDTSQQDPLLATWQYGLGRVVAWTPSVAGPWANAWVEWGSYGPFWDQVLRYILPEPDSGSLQIQFEPRPEGVRLIVDAFRDGGYPLDLADGTARITLPDNSQQDVTLHQVAPGRYVQDLLLPAEGEGAYAVDVSLAHTDGLHYVGERGYVHAVPDEYRPDQPGQSDQPGQPDQVGDNETGSLKGVALLEHLADTTGGRVINDETWTPTGDPQAAASPGLSLHRTPFGDNSWPWFLSAALVVWMLEIAIQRRTSYR
jgi:uncharacterized membrane protein